MEQRHSQLRELFVAACDLPQTKQDEFVDENCLDPELRLELKRLLRSDGEKSGIFSDGKTVDGVTVQIDTVVDTDLPEQIGKYKVKRLLGEGGMGVVYLAEQQNPSRDVAVKVIRQGMASPQLLKRFERESEVLGRLTHPGIASIHEAGIFVDNSTGQRLPFLAMEYIEGRSLRDYVRKKKLGTRERLSLLIQICNAVHHAHQRGVIHRDLKPGNVLVKEDGQPTILDFGVARATDADLGESTLQTHAGQLIGTLQYMSPEQAAGRVNEVDARSDVYSLGVIAYELLSDKLPYEFSDQDYLKAARAITEDNLVPLESIHRKFRGDLNTIIHKALEKRPVHRYQTALELASDVQRFLNHEPIFARKTGPVSRAWKWCQRNTVVATLLSLLALAIVLGFVGMARQTLKSINSERLAKESEKGTEQVLDLLVRSFRSPDPTIDGHDVKMVDVLKKTVSDLEVDMTIEPLMKAKLLHAIGQSFQSLSIFDQGVRVHQSALEIRTRELGEEHPDAMASMANLAALTFQDGDYNEALRLFIRSTELRTKALGEEHPDTLKSMNDLALGYQVHQKWDEALKLKKKTLEIMQRTLGPSHLDTIKAMLNLASFYHARGNYGQALPIAEEARRLTKKNLGDSHPTTLNSLNGLIDIVSNLRPIHETLPLHLEALAQHRDVLGEDHTRTLIVMVGTASAYLLCGNTTEGLPMLETALPAMQAKLGKDHPYSLECMTHLSLAYLIADRPDDALTLSNEWDRLSSDADWSQVDKVGGMTNLAEALLRTGQKEKGIEILEQTLKIRLTHQTDDPESLAITAYAYMNAGMFAEAEPLLRKSLDQLEELKMPDNWGQFIAQAALGESLAQQGNRDEAEPLLLSGVRGLMTEMTEPPYPTPRQIDDAIQRLIRFYELTKQSEKATEWQQIAEAKKSFRESDSNETSR